MTKDIDEKIDNLARMVQGGFEQVEKRFDVVENRLERVENRLERVESDIESVRVVVGDTYSTVIRLEGKDSRDLKERVELLEGAIFPGPTE